MKPVAWMSALSAGSWLAAAALLDARTAREALFGMLAPLLVAVVTWPLVEQTYTRTPERLTALMVAAFGGKLLFFGAYVTVMLKGLGLRPVPFVTSFMSYFIALHLIEALYLRRLFAGGMGAPR